MAKKIKTVIVLAGTAEFVKKQSCELAAYREQNRQNEEPTAVWLITNGEASIETLSLPLFTDGLLCARIKTVHLAEEYLAVLESMYALHRPQQLLFASDSFCSSLAVRLAYRLQGCSCTGVTGQSEAEEGRLMVRKNTYGNNLEASFVLAAAPFCLSIAKGFKGREMAVEEGVPQLPVQVLAEAGQFHADWLLGYEYSKNAAEESLSSANAVVAIGRGVGSKADTALAFTLAESLKGEVGGTRPVVMNAWLSMDRLLGVSGVIAAAEVCFVLGASGAAAFMSGIEKSKFIIAVNSDANAAVFQYADVAICGDWRAVAGEMLAILERKKAE